MNQTLRFYSLHTYKHTYYWLTEQTRRHYLARSRLRDEARNIIHLLTTFTRLRWIDVGLLVLFFLCVCARVHELSAHKHTTVADQDLELGGGGEVDLLALLAFPPFAISSFTQNKVGGGGLPYIRLCTKRAQISRLQIGPWHLVCTLGSTSEVLGQCLSNSSEDFVSNEITSKRTK